MDEDIDLSVVSIHHFLYNQGMRASRAREIYQMCQNNVMPEPTPAVFGDDSDRDRHALRRFRNALSVDQVPNVQFAYQQCGLKDDGQGMSPQEIEKKKRVEDVQNTMQERKNHKIMARENPASLRRRPNYVRARGGGKADRDLHQGPRRAVDDRVEAASLRNSDSSKDKSCVLIRRSTEVTTPPSISTQGDRKYARSRGMAPSSALTNRAVPSQATQHPNSRMKARGQLQASLSASANSPKASPPPIGRDPLRPWRWTANISLQSFLIIFSLRGGYIQRYAFSEFIPYAWIFLPLSRWIY